MKTTHNPNLEATIQNFLSDLEQEINKKNKQLEKLFINLKNMEDKKLEKLNKIEFLKKEILKQTDLVKELPIDNDYCEKIKDDVKRMEYNSYVITSKLDDNFEQLELKKPLEIAILEAVVAAMTRFAEDLKQKPILNSTKAWRADIR